MAHKTAKEVVAAGNAVYGARLGRGKHRLNGLLKFWRNALVSIEHQDIITCGMSLRALALDAVALPVSVDKDFCACCPGNVHRVVRTSGVKNDYLVSPGNRRQAIRKQVGGVFGDHDDRQTR